MRILAKCRECRLVSRYQDRYFLHFPLGQNRFPCEYPVSRSTAQAYLLAPELMLDARSLIRKSSFVDREFFYRVGLLNFLVEEERMDLAEAEHTFSIFQRAPHILHEFYLAVLFGDLFQGRMVRVNGESAKSLRRMYNLTLFESYSDLLTGYLKEKSGVPATAPGGLG